jgi:hypothetical protein
MKHIVWSIQAVCVLSLVGLLGCTSPIPPSPIGPARLSPSHDQAMIQALHRRLHERERTIARQHYQIEVLSSQFRGPEANRPGHEREATAPT